MGNEASSESKSAPARPKSFLDESLRCLEASDSGTSEAALIHVLQALTWATLSVAEETSRT